MEYLYEKERRSFEDLAGGRVLYNQPGATSFPCRIASEVFLRGAKRLSEKGEAGPYNLYDPCCGGGYLLTVLGLLHGSLIRRIMASDIDDHALELAERNLSLLSPAGMDARIEQLERLCLNFGKESHRQALDSARRLRLAVLERDAIHSTCFRADILNPGVSGLDIPERVDLVISDLPYGDLTHWSEDCHSAGERFLEGIAPVLNPHAVAVVISDKSQSVRHDKFVRIGRLKIGKRQVTILEPNKSQ